MDRDLISLALMCVFSGSRLHNKTHVEAVGLESEPKEAAGRKADKQCRPC